MRPGPPASGRARLGGAFVSASRWFEVVLPWRHLILVIAAAVFSVQRYQTHGGDWEFFVEGVDRLLGREIPPHLGPAGLHIYANYPWLQIGPLSFIVSLPFTLLGDGKATAVVALTAAAPAFVFALERLALRGRQSDPRAIRRTQWAALGGGLMLMAAWVPLGTVFVHIDDVLVLGFGCASLWAVAGARAGFLGLFVGLAMAAKPWGIILVPLLLVFRGRDLARAIGIVVAITGAAWLPFVVADPDTLDAMEPWVATSPASVLHLFGADLTAFPTWVRPVQLSASLAAGVVAVLRGRWQATLLVGIAVRLLLDPGVFAYYTAGLVLAALAWDLLRSAHPLPLWTLATFWSLDVALMVVPNDRAQAVLRLLITVAIVGSALFGRSADASGSALSRGVTRATATSPG